MAEVKNKTLKKLEVLMMPLDLIVVSPEFFIEYKPEVPRLARRVLSVSKVEKHKKIKLSGFSNRWTAILMYPDHLISGWVSVPQCFENRVPPREI
jgi:hypothetical protein